MPTTIAQGDIPADRRAAFFHPLPPSRFNANTGNDYPGSPPLRPSRMVYGVDAPDAKSETLGADAENRRVHYIRRVRTKESVAASEVRLPDIFGSKPRVAAVRRERMPWFRFTLRKEYGQDSRNLSGLHTRIQPGARSSTSPVAMAPALLSRPTERIIPGSYGSTNVPYAGSF